MTSSPFVRESTAFVKYCAPFTPTTLCALSVSTTAGAVASLADARRILSEGPVDVVFLDVQLAGGENGLDLIRSIPPDVKQPRLLIRTNAWESKVLIGSENSPGHRKTYFAVE